MKEILKDVWNWKYYPLVFLFLVLVSIPLTVRLGGESQNIQPRAQDLKNTNDFIGEIVVQNISLEKIDETSILFSWTTNLPSKGKILFGSSPTTLNSTISDISDPQTNHNVIIEVDSLGKTLYYKIVSKSIAGKEFSTGVQSRIID